MGLWEEYNNTPFKKLIKRYANGKKICNCREAYEKPCGEGIINGEHRTDLMACEHGCSANLISAKEYVAEMVIKEFGLE